MNQSNRTTLIDTLLPQARPMALEQRFMFDAAAVTAVTEPQYAPEAVHSDSTANDSDLARFAEPATVTSPVTVRALDVALNNGRKEVAFIDTGVADYQTLVDGVRAGVEVVLLDAGQNGLAQMALWAQSHTGYDAIHVLSHGTKGTVYLGSAELNQSLLSNGQVDYELNLLGTSLNSGGDLLLYGCSIAEGSAGQTFVLAIAQLTNSDVAASTNATGSIALGGDWVLETDIGDVTALSAIDLSTTATYNTLLAVPADQNFDALSPGLKVAQASTSTINSWSESGITYKINGGADISVINAGDVDTFGGSQILAMNLWASPSFASTYFEISSTSNSDNFKLNSIDFDTVASTDGMTYIMYRNYVVTGYDNGAQVASATVNFGVSATYGTAADAIAYTKTASEVAGTLQFSGANWGNIDAIRFTRVSGGSANTLSIQIDNLDFSPPVAAADTTPPNAPSTPDMTNGTDTGTSATDNITNNTTPTFTGTAEANSTVKLYDTDGTTLLGTAMADGSGSWSITSSALSQGNHTLTATATDGAGNTSVASSSLAVTVDTTAPTVTVASAAFSADTGTSSSDFITKTAAQTISGTLSANLASGETVYVSLDNGSTWTAATATVGQNTWSLSGQTLTTSNTLKVRVSDAAGNNGTAYSQAYVLDTTPPTTTVATKSFSADTGSSSTDFITKTAAQTISGTLSANVAAGEVVYVSLDNGSTWAAATTSVGANTWSLSGQTLAASNTLKIKVTDAAGNDGTVSSQAYVLDTTAPTAPSAPDMTSVTDSGASNSDNITSNTTPVFNGTATANSTVTLYDTDGTTVLGTTTSDGSGNWSITSSTLSSATHTITAKVTDTAGNDSIASAGLTITVVDSVAPTVSSVGVPANADYTVGYVLDFTVNFSEVVIVNTTGGTPRIELTIGSTTVYAEYLSGSGTNPLTFRYTIQANDLDTDGIALNALGLNGGTINDAAGNNATLTLNSVDPTTGVKVDAVDPSAPSTPNLDAGSDSGSSNTDNITSDNTPTFSGTAEAGSTVELYDGSTLIGSATAGVSGNWTITSAALSNGSHTITAKATDAAGNVSTVSSGLTITVDTAAPSAVSLDRNNVAETAATTGSTVAVLTATDASSVTFALASGLGDANNGSFTIANGNLVAASNLSAGTYNVRVSATDAAGNVTYETFVITVSSNTAPAITSGASVTVVENAPSATTVYTATASDADAGQTLTFSLTGADAALFNLNASTGVVTLRNSANYEARSSYSFNVVVTDDGAGNLSDTKAVTVTVVDANDPATGTLTVGGIPKQGETLTANDTLVDEDGINGRTYQWFADGLPINGANQSTFVLGQAQVGKAITVKVSYTDGAGRQEEFISAATASVATNVSGFSPAPVVSPQPVAPVITLVQAAPIEIVSPSVSSFFSSPVGGTIAMLTSDPLISSVVMPWASDMPGQRAATGVVAVGVSPMAGTNFFGLRAMEASRDIVIERGEQASFTLPAGTFVHTDGNARVSLSARLADGRPLPSFVKFNPTTGTFTVEAGSGEQAEQLQVVVNAVDDKGQTASTTVVIKLKEKARTSSELDMQIKLGKPALVEQFRQADKPAGAMAELAALSKAFAASQLERSRA